MLPDLLQGQGGRNRLVRGRHGLILYNANDFVIGRSVEEYGEWFEQEVDVFRALLRPGDTAIDVGCNIGTHTLAMARIVGPTGHVIGIDPQAEMIRLASATMALNSLSNVRLIDEAAGCFSSREKHCRMNYDRPHSSFGGAYIGRFYDGEDVDVVPLSDICCDTVRLIKIDVEGYESEVLRGADVMINRDRPFLYVENDRVPKSRELLQLLADLGYRSYWHMPLFHNPANFAGREKPFHACGLVEAGHADYYDSVGFATNMLCIPKEMNLTVVGQLKEATDFDWHPFLKSNVQVAA